jgi:hypothetical protein
MAAMTTQTASLASMPHFPSAERSIPRDGTDKVKRATAKCAPVHVSWLFHSASHFQRLPEAQFPGRAAVATRCLLAAYAPSNFRCFCFMLAAQPVVTGRVHK